MIMIIALIRIITIIRLIMIRIMLKSGKGGLNNKERRR